MTTIINLMQITSHPRTDPILLTAICTFCCDVFENEALTDDEEFMFSFFEQLNYMQELLPYVGMEKYPDLTRMVKKYNSAPTRAPGEDAADEKDPFATDNFLSATGGKKSKVNMEVVETRKRQAIAANL